jgi:hypothetical protein
MRKLREGTMELFNLSLGNLGLMTVDFSWLETLVQILQFIGDIISFLLGIFSLINQFRIFLEYD